MQEFQDVLSLVHKYGYNVHFAGSSHIHNGEIEIYSFSLWQGANLIFSPIIKSINVSSASVLIMLSVLAHRAYEVQHGLQ